MAKGRQQLRKIDFEELIGSGENPQGFTAQTVNGTAHATGTGWNRYRPWSEKQIVPEPAWPTGRNNRTGE